METSAEAFRIADAAIAAGHQVRVVPGTLVRLLGVGDRGVKNDKRDAQQLSKASWQTDIPSVHIPSKLARELRSICGARDVLVGTRTKLINNVRGWMRTQLWRFEGGRRRRFRIGCAGMPPRLASRCPSTSSVSSGRSRPNTRCVAG
jgi:transposase